MPLLPKASSQLCLHFALFFEVFFSFATKLPPPLPLYLVKLLLMVNYKNKIVCFIDILGFGKMVSKEYLDNPFMIYSILRKIDGFIRDWFNATINSESELEITQFSDSIVLSVLPVGHYFMNFNFFKELSIAMIKEGVVFRGGITYGQIHHDTEFVFGPAMNCAYYLESKIANYPRILLDKSVLDLKNDDDKVIADYPGQFVIAIEESGYSHIDYIKDVRAYTDQATYYQKLREMISKGLQSDDDSIKNKYEWMKKENNRAKENFSELEAL